MQSSVAHVLEYLPSYVRQPAFRIFDSLYVAQDLLARQAVDTWNAYGRPRCSGFQKYTDYVNHRLQHLDAWQIVALTAISVVITLQLLTYFGESLDGFNEKGGRHQLLQS